MEAKFITVQKLNLNYLLKIIESCAPKVKLRHKQKDLPWLDASFFKLRYFRDKLYHRAVKSRLQDDWMRYKQARNDYSRLIKTISLKKILLILNILRNIGISIKSMPK
jgi:hypothetical protein